MQEITGVAVVGLGKIGLPLALTLAGNGCRVYGVDISADVVSGLNSKSAHIEEAGISEKLGAAIDAGTFSASTDLDGVLPNCNYVVVAVPLFIDEENKPDFASIDQVSTGIGRHISFGTTVIFETTLPVGTCRNRFAPILERESGFTVDDGLYVAYSPERISTGTAFRDLSKYPKLVGGVTPSSGEKAAYLYAKGLKFDSRPDLPKPNGVWNLGSTEGAEFAKLAETTFRDVNIALANTFAEHAQNLGVSYGAIQEACNSQPFSLLHSPGISVGGHCIPVYPHLYLQSHPAAELVSLSRAINKSAPSRGLDLLEREIGKLEGKQIIVSGLSFRTGVKEAAYSGALDLYGKLAVRGAVPSMVDELFSTEEIRARGLRPLEQGGQYDAMVVNSGSREFNLSLLPLLKPGAAVIDGRGEMRSSDHDQLIHIGEA